MRMHLTVGVIGSGSLPMNWRTNLMCCASRH